MTTRDEAVCPLRDALQRIAAASVRSTNTRDARDALSWCRAVANTALAPAPAPASGGVDAVALAERCREIIAWHDTGLLKGEALRSFAQSMGLDLEDHDALIRAESKTARQCMEFVLASLSPAATSGSEAWSKLQGALSKRRAELEDDVRRGWSVQFSDAAAFATVNVSFNDLEAALAKPASSPDGEKS